jgi:maleylacetoacetate isomerase
VRIALHLKAIPFEQRPVNVLKGEHRSEELAQQLPFTLVPSLVLPGSGDGGQVLAESLAIMEYLEGGLSGKLNLLNIIILLNIINLLNIIYSIN